MHETVDRVVTPFLAAADAALGAGYSALLYGSAARGDYLAGRSNINLLLVLDDASPTRLRALAPAFAAWRKAAVRAAAAHQPGRVGAGDGRVPDRDHRHARRLPGASRGRSRWAPLVCSGADLRQALERELRGKLLRLRQGYAAAAGDEKLLGEVAAGSAGTILVLLRSLLSLAGRPVPAAPAALAAEAAALVGGTGRGAGRRRSSVAASAAGGVPRRSSSNTWTPWRGRRGTWINFSSETSDEALVGGRLDRSPCSRCSRRAAGTTRFRRWTNG